MSASQQHQQATREGLARARAEGKKLGRPVKAEAQLRDAAALVLLEGVPMRVAVHRVNKKGGEQIALASLHRYVEKLRAGKVEPLTAKPKPLEE